MYLVWKVGRYFNKIQLFERYIVSTQEDADIENVLMAGF